MNQGIKFAAGLLLLLGTIAALPLTVFAAGGDAGDEDVVGDDPFAPGGKQKGDADCSCFFFNFLPTDLPLPLIEVFPTEVGSTPWFGVPDSLWRLSPMSGGAMTCNQEEGYAHDVYLGTFKEGKGPKFADTPNMHEYETEVTVTMSWKCRAGIWQPRKMHAEVEYEGTIVDENDRRTYHGTVESEYTSTTYPNYQANPSATKIEKSGKIFTLESTYDGSGNFDHSVERVVTGKGRNLFSGNTFRDHQKQSISQKTEFQLPAFLPSGPVSRTVVMHDNICSEDVMGSWSGADYSETLHDDGSITPDKFLGHYWQTFTNRRNETTLDFHLHSADYYYDEGFVAFFPYIWGKFNSITNPWSKQYIKNAFTACSNRI